MRYLRIDDAVKVQSTFMNRNGLTVNRLTCAQDGLGPSEEHALENAILIALQLQNYRGELWKNGRRVPVGSFAAGEFTAYDLRDRWKANLVTQFDCVNFHIPQALFNASSLGLEAPVDEIDIGPGTSIGDPIVKELAAALLTATMAPCRPSRVFTDHVEMALLSHLACRYGRASGARRHFRGLSPLQLDMVTDMLSADLSGDTSVADLAAACGMPPGPFTLAFRTSTGLPPYKWLQKRRVEVAKDLLLCSRKSLTEIAEFCGFADQSHLSRVFQRWSGMPPGAYRRKHATDDYHRQAD